MKKELETVSSMYSLYDEEEIQEIRDIEKIDLILKKYRISKDENELINSLEKNTLLIINHIADLSKKELAIQKDLVQLFEENHSFIKYVNLYLVKKLESLTNNDSTYFFKDISLMFKIFSISTPYNLFNSYNDYNYKDLSSLLRNIENDLIKLFNEKDNELFEIKFQSYVLLLESLTQLCLINSTNHKRRDSINIFLELMRESINILKYNIQLEQTYLMILNHIQGTHLYYFIDSKKIEISNDNLEEVFSKLYYQIERLEDGYYLSKNSNFGGENNYKDENQEFLIFKSNASVLILDLLKDLDTLNINLNAYKKLDSFKKVLKTYSDHFYYEFEENYELESIDNFRNTLLDSLIYEYQINKDFTKTINHKTILSDFIFSDKKFKNINLKTIYLILKYANSIENFKYLNIGQTLAKSKKITNDYHEYFKLKILDLIITYYSNNNINYEALELFELIKKYVDENKTASHLIELYTHIYLDLAIYYSREDKTMNTAKEYYFSYIYTNSNSFLTSHHKKANKEFLLNLGNYYKKDLKLNTELYAEDEIIQFSEKLLNTYKKNKYLEIKLELSNDFSMLSNEILNNPLSEFNDIYNHITYTLENKLFYGLAQVSIVGNQNEKKEFKDIGFKQYIIELDNNYALHFNFPLIVEERFKEVLNTSKTFLITNINNILNTLNQNSKQLVDKATGLYNIDKLKETIRNHKDTKLGFIEIFIKSIDKINREYGFDKNEEIFQLIANEIKTISKDQIGTYKLEGSKIGILLNNRSTHKELINEIKNLVVKYKNDYIKIDSYLSYTEDRKDRILFSSAKSMDEVIMNEINK